MLPMKTKRVDTLRPGDQIYMPGERTWFTVDTVERPPLGSQWDTFAISYHSGKTHGIACLRPEQELEIK